MRQPTAASRRQGWTSFLLLAFVPPLLVTASGTSAPAQASTPIAERANGEKYLGRWNYDLPDSDTMKNVAVASCPASRPGCPTSGFSLQVPQIGDIVFSRGDEGRIIGHTDAGCSWRFAVRADSLELDPGSQYCKSSSGLAYTIAKWTIKVSGRHETETFEAKSHHAEADFDFVLMNGSRTRTGDRDWRGMKRRFAGAWQYDTADPASGVNIRVTQHSRPDADPEVVRSPERGSVTFTKNRDHTLTGLTQDGCRWSLAVRGNTAHLDPAPQTCTLSGSAVTLNSWTIASDGKRQSSVMTGIDAAGGTFLLNPGNLTRQRSPRSS